MARLDSDPGIGAISLPPCVVRLAVGGRGDWLQRRPKSLLLHASTTSHHRRRLVRVTPNETSSHVQRAEQLAPRLESAIVITAAGIVDREYN